MTRKKSLSIIGILLALQLAVCLFVACGEAEAAAPDTSASDANSASLGSEAQSVSASASRSTSRSTASSSSRAASGTGSSSGSSAPSGSGRPPASSQAPAASSQPPASSQPNTAPPLQKPAPAPSTPAPAPEPPPAPPPAPSVDIGACIDWGNAYAASMNLGVNGNLAIGAAGFENPIETSGKTEQQVKDHIAYQLNNILAMWQGIPEYDPNTVIPCYKIVQSGTAIYVLYG